MRAWDDERVAVNAAGDYVWVEDGTTLSFDEAEDLGLDGTMRTPPPEGMAVIE